MAASPRGKAAPPKTFLEPPEATSARAAMAGVIQQLWDELNVPLQLRNEQLTNDVQEVIRTVDSIARAHARPIVDDVQHVSSVVQHITNNTAARVTAATIEADRPAQQTAARIHAAILTDLVHPAQ